MSQYAWIGMDKVFANIGVSFEWTIVLIFLIGSMIFFAVDFKKGIVVSFLGSGGLFLWFYHSGYNYIPPVTLFFLYLIIMSLSLYTVEKTVSSGGLI